MKRRFISLILVIIIVTSCFTGISAADNAASSADALYALGLFKGTGIDSFGRPVYELDRAPTRQEAVVMLIRLLGREDEALSGSFRHPFSDVESWADKYVAYAYAMGLTKGTASSTFGSGDVVSAAQFLTFTLRALGYSDSTGDFTWSRAPAFSDSIGLTSGEFSGSGSFLRGDIAVISFNALSQTLKDKSTTLIQSLVDASAVTKSAAEAAGLSDALKKGQSEIPAAQQVYAESSPAVFYIEAYSGGNIYLNSGSGFFISSSGLAVTSWHVLRGASSAKVVLSDGQTVCNVTGVYDYNEDTGLALIKIDGNVFPFLKTGDSAGLSAGSTVYAIGSPLGLTNTLSQGIISNANRLMGGQQYIQNTAQTSAGSSGGALLNANGQVIGMTVGTLPDGQNLNFAVPIRKVEELSSKFTRTLTELSMEFKMSASKVPLSVSDNLICLTAGESVVLKVYHGWDGYGEILLANSSPSVAHAVWGEWIDGNSINLKITGVLPGTTTVTVRLYDMDGELMAISMIGVTVTSLPPIGNYDNFPAVPDFGSLSGVRTLYDSYLPARDGRSGYIGTYYYSLSAIEKLCRNGSLLWDAYVLALTDSGFECVETFYSSERYLVKVYANTEQNKYVLFGVTDIPGETCYRVMIMNIE